MSADEVWSGTGMSTTTLTADSLLLKVLLMRRFTCTRAPHSRTTSLLRQGQRLERSREKWHHMRTSRGAVSARRRRLKHGCVTAGLTSTRVRPCSVTTGSTVKGELMPS